MAGLIRSGVARAMSNCRGLGKGSLRRGINTSSKKTSVTTSEACPAEPKNWISYGFSDADPWIDRLSMHVTAFTAISLVFVFGGFYIAHIPDAKLMEWAQREAYLELRRRESLGLLPIEADYFDPAKISLPTDEDLGDTEIII